jgi:hypothetical protein
MLVINVLCVNLMWCSVVLSKVTLALAVHLFWYFCMVLSMKLMILMSSSSGGYSVHWNSLWYLQMDNGCTCTWCISDTVPYYIQKSGSCGGAPTEVDVYVQVATANVDPIEITIPIAIPTKPDTVFMCLNLIGSPLIMHACSATELICRLRQ